MAIYFTFFYIFCFYIVPQKIPTLAPPDSYVREAIGTAVTVLAVEYNAESDAIVGPYIDWAERDGQKTYMIAKVKQGKKKPNIYDPELFGNRV